MPVVLPDMVAAQGASWHGLMDLYDAIPRHWALVGGQLVHLHCAERKTFPQRPTVDIDAVVDIRAEPAMLDRFTGALKGLGFVAETSGEGLQHRWTRGLAQIDVLIPEGVGEKAAARTGAGGAPTLPAPGATQALRRTQAVPVVANGRSGTVLRPDLIGALVMKAAARLEVVSDVARGRHCVDFTVLSGLIAARDVREAELTKKDLKRLRAMVALCSSDRDASAVPDAARALTRLTRAIDL